jgi:CRP-like cAMP-binding protein
VNAELPPAWKDLLASAELFRDLDSEARAKLWAAASRKSAARPAILFSAGEEARHLFLLVAGRVKLVRSNAEGQEVIMRFVAPGEILGGIAALPRGRYPLSAEVIEDADLVAWSRESLAPVVAAHPALTTALLGR